MSRIYFNHTTKLVPVKLGYSPAATIALEKVGNTFRYGVTICSKYDNFSKKKGREFAEQRMRANFGTLEVPDVLRGLPEKEACLTQLYNLTESLVLKPKRWKSKITKFNMSLEKPATDNSARTVSYGEYDHVLGKLVDMNDYINEKPRA